MKARLPIVHTTVLFASLLWFAYPVASAVAAPHPQAATPTPSSTQGGQAALAQGIQLFEAAQWQEAFDTLTAAQAAAQKQGDQETLATALLYIGRIHAQQNAHADALKAFETSALIWEKQAEQVKLLETLQAIAELYVNDKNYEQALTTYTTALHLAQNVNDAETAATIQNQLAETEYQLGLTTFLADLEKARQGKNQAKEASILKKLGDLHRLHDHAEEALAIYTEELALRRTLADQANLVDALRNIGRSHVALTQYDAAATAYAEALAVAQELGDEEMQAELLSAQGEVQIKLAQYAEAQTSFEAEIKLRQSLQDQAGEATAYSQLASVYQALEENALAQGALEKAITLWQTVDNQEQLVETQIELGHVLDAQQQYEMAIELYATVLSTTQQLSDQTTHIRVIYSLAEDHYKLQQYAQALPYYEEALTFWQGSDDQRNQLKVLRRLGELHLALNAPGPALEHLQAALPLAEAAQDLEVVAKVYEDMAKAQSGLAQGPATLSAYQKALTLWQQLQQDEQILEVSIKIGDYYYRQVKQYEQAQQTFQTALTLAEKIGDREQQANLFQRLADTYAKQKNYEAALTNYEQAIALWREVGRNDKAQKVSADLANVQNDLQAKQLEANAQSGIVEPTANATVSGIISVRGIANDPAFQKWQLDLLLNQDPNNATFLEVGRRVAPKIKSLVDLDTTQYPNGTHTLRLRVVRTDFNYDEYTVVITIAN